MTEGPRLREIPALPARIERITTPQARYLGRIDSTVADLLTACRDASGEVSARMVASRLALLRDAIGRSPYYRSELESLALAPSDLTTTEDLRYFPMLDRTTLQRRWQELPVLDDGDPEARRIVAVQSSGSTGMPVTIVKDGYDAVYMWAALRFWLAWIGITLPRRPRATMLCSLPGGLEYSVRLPLLHRGALHRISLLRPDAAARLQRTGASVVLTDPAGLHWLAGLPAPPRPLLVLSSAQYLSSHERRRTESSLGAPVLNYYSSTETTQVAWECLETSGRFHVMVPDYWVESVDGELVVTRLRPGLVPLLRYRTGDPGQVGRDDCSCGYHGWTITGFTGRRASEFRRPDGTVADAWQLAWVFKHQALRDFRLTQVEVSRFVVEVVGEANERALAKRLTSALRNLGWTSPVVELRTVEEIASTAGKPEPFRGLR